MLDVKDIIKRPNYYRERLANRESWYALFVNDLIQYEIARVQEERHYNWCKEQQNNLPKRKPIQEELDWIKLLKEDVLNSERLVKKYEMILNKLLMLCPNIPDDSVPIGMIKTLDSKSDRFKYILSTSHIYDNKH